MLPALLHSAAAASLSILFLGNSHTAMHGVPHQVKALLEASGQGPVVVGSHSGAGLEELAQRSDVARDVASSKWDVVVLQGAKLSMSRKVRYAQDGAIRLGRLATQRKANLLWFAEWPRRGIDETPYILGIYSGLERDAGGRVVPMGYATEAARNARASLDLWAADGNHASPAGAHLAAQMIARWLLDGRDPADAPLPDGVNRDMSQILRSAASAAWERVRHPSWAALK